MRLPAPPPPLPPSPDRFRPSRPRQRCVAVHYGSRREDAEQTLEGLAGTGHVLAGVDLSDPAGAAAVADLAAEGLGGIDILVNNAAVNERHPLPETSYDEWATVWQRHVAVNLLATGSPHALKAFAAAAAWWGQAPRPPDALRACPQTPDGLDFAARGTAPASRSRSTPAKSSPSGV